MYSRLKNLFFQEAYLLKQQKLSAAFLKVCCSILKTHRAQPKQSIARRCFLQTSEYNREKLKENPRFLKHSLYRLRCSAVRLQQYNDILYICADVAQMNPDDLFFRGKYQDLRDARK